MNFETNKSNSPRCWSHTVDGNQKSGDHLLRLAVYPIVYRVLAPSQVVQDFWTINSIYVVVSNIFYLFSSRMLGKIPVLTHMFHMGWNHQPSIESRISMWFLLLKLIVISLGWRLMKMHRHSGTFGHWPLSHHPLGEFVNIIWHNNFFTTWKFPQISARFTPFFWGGGPSGLRLRPQLLHRWGPKSRNEWND